MSKTNQVCVAAQAAGRSMVVRRYDGPSSASPEVEHGSIATAERAPVAPTSRRRGSLSDRRHHVGRVRCTRNVLWSLRPASRKCHAAATTRSSSLNGESLRSGVIASETACRNRRRRSASGSRHRDDMSPGVLVMSPSRRHVHCIHHRPSTHRKTVGRCVELSTWQWRV